MNGEQSPALDAATEASPVVRDSSEPNDGGRKGRKKTTLEVPVPIVTIDRSELSVSRIMGEIQLTLSNFHTDCTGWEADLERLICELDASGPERDGAALRSSETDILSELGQLRQIVDGLVQRQRI